MLQAFAQQRLRALLFLLAVAALPGPAAALLMDLSLSSPEEVAEAEARFDAPSLSPMPANHKLPAAVLQALAAAQLPPESLAVQVQALPGVREPEAKLASSASRPQAWPLPHLAYQSQRPMNPASTMKLLSTYAAFDALGADFVWRTSVFVDGPIRGGVLRGNVIVQGGADPYLDLTRARALVAALQAKGIRHIEGDWLVDSSLFALPPHNPAAFDGKPERPYNAGPQALLLNMAALDVGFAVDADLGQAMVDVQPPLWGVSWPPSLPLGAGGSCALLDQRLGLDLSQPEQLQFKNAYPAGCPQGRVYWAYYRQPELFAARGLAGLWQEAGGTLRGQARLGRTPAKARLLFRQPSPPLAEVAATINRYSNNVMTQQVFLSLPLFAGRAKAGQKGSFAASQAWLEQWWQQHWPQMMPPVVENGSGLSRRERISAEGMSALLVHAAQSPSFAPFYHSLALAGEEGTLRKMRRRSPHNAALGRAKLKTGTLDDVKAIAGYVQGQGGQMYAVVAFVNHPSRAHAGEKALDALLDWVARDLPAEP